MPRWRGSHVPSMGGMRNIQQSRNVSHARRGGMSVTPHGSSCHRTRVERDGVQVERMPSAWEQRPGARRTRPEEDAARAELGGRDPSLCVPPSQKVCPGRDR